MMIPRVIPVLLLKNRGLVKTLRFAEPIYVGDPLNAVRIFNEKEVDELIFLDITATAENRGPALDHLHDVATECFMPFTYGGGVRSIEQMRGIFKAGAEKIAVNTAAAETSELITEAARIFGSQSIVVSIDVRRSEPDGRPVTWIRGGRNATELDAVAAAVRAQKLGAGEILLNSIDRDGTQEGYDLDLIRAVSAAVSIPVIACGGASSVGDFTKATLDAGAAAAAAGSYFVFCGSRDAVLITYPGRRELEAAFRTDMSEVVKKSGLNHGAHGDHRE